MFNFRGDDVFKDIAMLSGGERGRVVLTEVLLKQANFLILDEPTNHLDISSKEVLEEALRSFEGTILFISHDRYFINKIATRVIEVQKDQCLSYNGNYDDYLNQKTPVVETTQKVVTEAKQRQIIDKKTKNEIKKLERTIDSLEKEINSLKEELTSEEVMNNYKKYITAATLDNAANKIMSSTFIVGYAIFLGLSDRIIGLYVALKSIMCLVQIFSASIFSRIGQSKKVTLTLYSLYRLFGAMPILIPFIAFLSYFIIRIRNISATIYWKT